MKTQKSGSQNNIEEIEPIKKTLLNLLNKPIKNETLNEKEFNFIVEIIGIYPKILNDISFNPNIFYELMEKNEILATEIMYTISTDKIFEDYLKIFFDNRFSINSVKVIYKLIQRVEFPIYFINFYIKNLINIFKTEINLFQKQRIGKLISYFCINLLDFGHITIDMIPTNINILFNNNNKDPDILKLKDKLSSFRN